ncbi:M42 family metallopeptidase [Deinococcus maricopensis]|nr:M42 family metallopeptidase [Deinococcus maricopensis]
MSPHVDLSYTVDLLLRLLNTPSPTGFTEGAIALAERELSAMGLQGERTKKGALRWTLPGTSGGRHLTFSAHVDTLGAMVKSIKPNGRLTLTRLGGYDWHSIEGEYVQVHTQAGNTISGTIVLTRQSIHVYADASTTKRDADSLEVRLDERTASDDDTRALGVQVGDFVSFDPRAQHLPSGHIKSRHLDNKAAAAILLAVTRALHGAALPHTVTMYLSTYEEVGHGAAHGIPDTTDELIAVDMAALGEGQNGSEHHVTLCVKDSTGPYDHALGNRLRAVAHDAGIDLRPDIYPHYGSDASAAWAAGGDYPAALIGPGVDASHAYERTHEDALRATADLIVAYVTSP